MSPPTTPAKKKRKSGNATAAAASLSSQANALAWEENYFRDRFLELVAYKAHHGHVDVPARTAGILGAWTKALRRQYRDKELPLQRIQLLQTIGFDFQSDAGDVMALEQRYFQQRVFELVQYRAIHGDCHVPKDGSVLSKWVGSIRAQYKRQEIPADRIQLLESLGFEWKKQRAAKTMTNINTNVNTATTQQHREQQHSTLPNPLLLGEETAMPFGVSDNINLPNQLGTTATTATTIQTHNQQQQQQQPKGVRAMAYAADLDAKWHKKLEELIKYKEINGHCNVPQDHKELGRWVSTQREKKRQTDLVNAGHVFPADKKRRPCLPDDQIAKLEAIGFKWKVNTIVGWDARYEQLLEYRRKHGDVHVPQSYPEDVGFGRWVMKQRVQYNYRKKGMKNHMTDERIAKLEAIDFAWVAPGYSQKTHKRQRSDVEDNQVDVDVEQQHEGALDDVHAHHHHHLDDAAVGLVPPPPDGTTEPTPFVPAAFFHTSPPPPPPQPYML